MSCSVEAAGGSARSRPAGGLTAQRTASGLQSRDVTRVVLLVHGTRTRDVLLNEAVVGSFLSIWRRAKP